MIKHILVTVLVTLITGCSSPPPPVPVEWNKKPVSLNEKLPEWNPNSLIIKSPVINDKCTEKLQETAEVANADQQKKHSSILLRKRKVQYDGVKHLMHVKHF